MTTSSIEWQFGGVLSGLPPGIAWMLYAVAAVLAMVAVIGFYRSTLKPLSPKRKRALVLLRATLVLLLLVCLANPTYVKTEKPLPAAKATLAVLVDRSASMMLPDYRKATRLGQAVHRWRQHETEAAAAFLDIKYYRFATKVEPTANLKDALEAPEPGAETRLYAAERAVLATHPGAIVCLTDGLDTTGAGKDELTSEALRTNTPLYFAVGTNHLIPSHQAAALDIREIKAPGSVMRQTEFIAEAVFTVATPQASELPVELWTGDIKLASAVFPVRPGPNMIPWTVPLVAPPDVRTLPLEFRAGTNEAQQRSSCTVEIVNHHALDILYYQGALQWGYRFLRLALANDPNFRMTGIINPALRVRITGEDPGRPALVDLPEDSKELKPFQIVVLAHVFANQLTARQQAALVDYVNGGGAVVFIAPDSQAAAGFAGSELEQMLPVAFTAEAAAESAKAEARDFRQQLSLSVEQDDTSEQSQKLPFLQPFSVAAGTPHSSLSALFQVRDQNLPYYAQNARVSSVKPGAEVVAVSAPTHAGGTPEVLLARQRFGNGQVVALMTDLLWRWKLALPSGGHELEKFWQQLLFTLAPPVDDGLRLAKVTEAASTEEPVVFRITQRVDADAPTLTAVSPLGERQPVLAKAAPEGETGWTATLLPKEAGNWEVQATGLRQQAARLVFSVSGKSRSTELMNLPSDISGLGQLAGATGGALLEEAPVFQPREGSATMPEIKHSQALWNSPWLLGLLLALYATELIVRRVYRLL